MAAAKERRERQGRSGKQGWRESERRKRGEMGVSEIYSGRGRCGEREGKGERGKTCWRISLELDEKAV